MDFLEKEYGIKEGQSYQITYENDVRDRYHIKKGLIINFTPQQIVVKSDMGLHIFKPRYITEMKPLDKLATFKDFCEQLEKTEMLNSTKVQDTLQKVGIALYNNDGTMKSMYDIMNELSKVFKNMDKDEEYKHTKANIKDNVCSVLVGIQHKNKLISALDKLESDLETKESSKYELEECMSNIFEALNSLKESTWAKYEPKKTLN